MTSEVYFTDMKSENAKNSMIWKLQKLYDETKFNEKLEVNEKIAIKTHFGERGNTAYIQPTYIRQIVDSIKEKRAKPFVTDTNTLYHAYRDNSIDHIETATRHGFTYSVINAPVIIADGLNGTNNIEIEINKTHSKK
ncbi:DUF362 domain-containing protein [Methanosphaera sp.]